MCHQLYHQALPVQSNLYQQPMTMSMQTPPQFKHPTFTIQHPTLAVQPTHAFTLDTGCSQEIEALKNKVTLHQVMCHTDPEKGWIKNFRKPYLSCSLIMEASHLFVDIVVQILALLIGYTNRRKHRYIRRKYIL